MKLYLSSYRIPTPDELFALAGNDAAPIKVAVIPNAKDYYAERARRFKVQETKLYLQQLGLVPEIVDLRNYNSPEAVKEALQSFDMIWVSGGNTFCLRYEMQRSGFDTIVRDLLDNGMVYGGESAGACVAGTTLKGIEVADEPAFTETTIWEGLGLVPKIILPHTDNPMFAQEIAYNRELYEDNSSLLELTDSQALIINGDEHRMTEGLKQ